MFAGSHASVGARVRLCHFSDLHLGVLAFVVDGDTATRGDLPPFTLHPLHIRDGLASNLGNKSCSSLFTMRRSTVRLKSTSCLVVDDQELVLLRPLTLCDRDVFRFFDEKQVVQSSDRRGDDWHHSFSFEFFF